MLVEKDRVANNPPENQLLIYGKLIGSDAACFAVHESETTGHTITKNGLAREVFLWAWELYKEAGSLAEFKRSHPLRQKKRKAG